MKSDPLLGGVETGGSWCVCALGRRSGELLEVAKFPTEGPAETITRIVEFFGGSGRTSPDAVGVGAFGPVELATGSPRWGEILPSSPKRAWAGVSLGASLRSGLGVPVALDTDVNAAAIAELRWGAGVGLSSLGYLTVGTGIGAGLIIDGTPVHGLLHPEAGHIRVPHDRAVDPFDGVCPHHGDCWEGLACGPAIAARWSADPAHLPDDHPAWALEAGYLAAGLLAVMLVAAPQRIVLGGGVLERTGLLQTTRAELTRLLAGYLSRPGDVPSEAPGDYLVPAALGDEAGVLGALALAGDRLSPGMPSA